MNRNDPSPSATDADINHKRRAHRDATMITLTNWGILGKMTKATALVILGFIILTVPIICVYVWVVDMS